MAAATEQEVVGQPRYGIDAPSVLWTFLGIGAAGAACAGIGLQLTPSLVGWSLVGVGSFTFAWCSVVSATMAYGSLFGKLRIRDRILDGLALRGDEQILDVGCGRGLMLVGAAKRLSTGTATGIDVWNKSDQANNSQTATLANIQTESVGERVALRTADARALPFPDRTFDVVLSSWVVHNLKTQADRDLALREMVRVLRPGGKIAIVDIQHGGRYYETLQTLGLADIEMSKPMHTFFIPSHLVTGRKLARISHRLAR